MYGVLEELLLGPEAYARRDDCGRVCRIQACRAVVFAVVRKVDAFGVEEAKRVKERATLAMVT